MSVCFRHLSVWYLQLGLGKTRFFRCGDGSCLLSRTALFCRHVKFFSHVQTTHPEVVWIPKNVVVVVVVVAVVVAAASEMKLAPRASLVAIAGVSAVAA